ncbi:MAG: response regulator [Polyangia bacterium]|jgi:two-component system cell cycle response regulator DivK
MSAAAKISTVLLVDDDIHNQKIFETVLRHSGFVVRQASNGEEALREARAHHPDLILMDLSIPVIDGWECTRQLKADEVTRDIIILALTAHAMHGDEERALAAGCDGYLSKPISPRKLVEEVKSRLLGTRA